MTLDERLAGKRVGRGGVTLDERLAGKRVGRGGMTLDERLAGKRVGRGGMTLDERLAGKRVLVCVGAGGVGKTTISAALAMGLAARGRRALVVSIDPARRLATALGLDRLPGEPHLVDGDALAQAWRQARGAGAWRGGGGTARGGARRGDDWEGELWAMVLEPKATFDALIGRLARDERSREEVLSNRIYHELSTATAGSQEFTAVSKLFELEREAGFDAIVLDTPPSRNALDFLDAPDRLTRFLEGRALRVLLRPGGLAGGLVGRGGGLVFSVLARATGVNLLGDLSTFFRSLGGVLDGFAERARGVEEMLRDGQTSFVIVSSPEYEAASEAVFFHARLLEAGMPFGALVVNRVHETGVEGWDGDGVERAREGQRGRALDGHAEPAREGQRGRALDGELEQALDGQVELALARKLGRNLADFEVLGRRDRASVRLLVEALSEGEALIVPLLDGDVQDLGGLARVAGHLFG